MDQQFLDSISNMYPWASEDTAIRLAELARSNNIKSSALAVAIAQVTNSSDVAAIEKLINEVSSEIDDAESKISSVSKKVGKELKDAKSALNNSNGLQSIADLTFAGTQAINKVSHSVTSMIDGGGVVSRILTSAADFATTGAVATAGLGTVFAALMAEQEKSVRAMIDLGLLVNDDALYTNLRSRVSNFAMGVEDYTTILAQTKQMMTGLAGDTYHGQVQMLDFLQNSIDSDTIERFGYSPQEFVQQLSLEAATLYKLNEVNDLNFSSQRRVLESFDTANRLALFLSDNIGLQRSQALSLRQEARENLDFQLVMFQQADYIQEQLGDQARQNIVEANDFLYILMNQTIGEEMAQETQQVLSNYVRDIRFDTSAVNNIPGQLMETLQRISPDVATSFVSLIEDAGQGKISADEVILRYQEFIRLIDQSTAKISPDDIGREATAIRAQIATVPDSFFEITRESLDAGVAAAADASGLAGTSVETIGDIAIAFRQTQDMITPGYESMGDLFNVVVSSASTFGEVWSDIFGLEDFKSPEERQRILLERQQEAATIASYNAGGSSNLYYSQVTEARQQLTDQEMLIEQLEASYANAQDMGDIAEMRRLSEEIQSAYSQREVLSDQLEQVIAQRAFVMPSDSTAARPDVMVDDLLSFISSGEGGYNSSNRGTLNDRIVGSTHDTVRNGRNLEDLTFAEIFELQSIMDPTDPNRLFAVGRYQIIPETMREIFPHSGLSLDDKFTPENQDVLGTLLVVGNEETNYAKRAALAAYIRGESDNLQAAMLDFAREWASAPDPRTGMSYYGHGNRASHTREEVANALYASRVRYAENQSLLEERNTQAVVSELSSEQTTIQRQIADIQADLADESDNSQAELSEMRREMESLETQLAEVTEQLNSILASQNAAEALP